MTSRISVLQRVTGNAPLVIAFMLFIALAIPTSILNLAWEYMHIDLGQSYDALGVLLLFFTAGRVLSTFFAGRALARLGMWRSVILGMTLVLLGLFGTLLSPSWPVLLIANFASAYGWGMMDIGVNLYIAARRWKGIINFLHASYGIGLTLGPLLVTLVVVRLGYDWRWSYLVPLLVMLLLWVLTIISRAQWVLPNEGERGEGRGESEEEREARIADEAMLAQAENAEAVIDPDAPTLRAQPTALNPRPSASGASIRSTLLLPIMGPWLLFALIYAGFEVGTGQLSSDLLIKSRGLDAETASTWISLYWAAFTGGRFLSGLIAGRISERTQILGYTAFAAVGAFLLALPGLDLALPGLLLTGISLAGVFPTLISVIPRRFGNDHAPNIIGFTLASANIGIAILPGLGAFIAARAGFEMIGIFIVAMAVLLIASYMLILSRIARA
jgi:fucose permease